jgi:hypothetical protein
MAIVQFLMTVSSTYTVTPTTYQSYTTVQQEPFGTKKLSHAMWDIRNMVVSIQTVISIYLYQINGPFVLQTPESFRIRFRI